MFDYVKISQLAATGFVTHDHVFLIVRDGVTALRSWAQLVPTDLLILVSGGETKTTAFANVTGALSGGIPSAPAPDVAGTGFKISELPYTVSVSGADLFAVSDPLSEAAVSAEFFALREAKIRRVNFDTINALLSPAVLPAASEYGAVYANDAAAALGGVSPCGLYRITQGNDYGLVSPYGALLIRLPGPACLATYDDDAAAAIGGVPVGGVYNVSIDNPYGIISAGGRGIAVRTDDGPVAEFKGPFLSDATAATGGVLVGEPYLVAGGHEMGILSGGRTLAVRVL